MSINLRILLIIFSLLLLLIILNYVSKNRLPIKYSLFWIITAVLILFVGAFPNFIGIFTRLIGFETTSNLVIGIILTMLLIITLILTVIVSVHKKKIKLLIQEVSLLKLELNEVKNDKR